MTHPNTLENEHDGLEPIETEDFFGPIWRPVRVFAEQKGFQIYVGVWSARFSWSRSGWFANGSQWFSGWHKWREDSE